MRRSDLPSNWFFRVTCTVVLLIAAAASVTGYYERWPVWTTGIAEGSTEPYTVTMLTGTARRPYVYRHLRADVANFLTSLTPTSVQNSIYALVFPSDKAKGEAKFNLLAEAPEAVRRAWFFPGFILYLLTFASAMLAVIGMYLVCGALGFPSAVCLFASTIVILLAPYFYIYPYDYSELAFLAVGSWIALRFDWWWLLPIAVLGAWNKESFFFFMPTLYPFLRLRLSERRATLALGALTSICGLVYLYTRARFAQNAGTPVEFGLGVRISSFFDRFLLLTATDEVYGLRLVRISTLLPTLLLIWVIARVWKRFPQPMRNHGVLAASLNIPLYALFCSPNEYRNLSLLSIVFLVTIAFNLKEWLERSMPLIPAAGSN